MYAIVEIGGHQFKVSKDDVLFVNKLAKEADEKFDIARVLMVNDGNGNISVGKPVVEGATIQATVLDQVKADKVIVFKKKRRKGYRTKNGHRQPLTKIKIDAINL
jgi:large subunit ribosomal protein L21